MADYTQNEMLRQIFDEHWQEFCDYWKARTKDAGQVEQVHYDSVRHTGVLMKMEWQGVRKIVSVSPADLIAGLTQLNEELRQRCIDGAQSAEEAARYATEQGDYARTEGDRVDALISQISELKERVAAQGDTAEQQGAAAQAKMEEVAAWYQPFKSAAERWFSGIVSEVATWFSESRNAWTSWFDPVKQGWDNWFSDTVADWSAWFRSSKDDWDEWFAARKAEWNTWFSDASSAWTSWFHETAADWGEFFNTAKGMVTLWGQKEQERQSAEEIRLEMMAHPPIPSERGFWMLWDLETHDYVESGYSSRGTMDWPEFFWDYDTMGLGVMTTRDFSRFFIDEQGRFGMCM